LADLSDICEALATSLSAIPEVQTSAYVLANPTLPMLYILPDDSEYDKAFARALDDEFLKIQVLCAMVSDVAGQKRLLKFMAPSGADSIKAKAEADKRLGGLVNDLRVVSRSGTRFYTEPGRSDVIVGAEWRVQVMNPGT
jgi:hypothetical protein